VHLDRYAVVIPSGTVGPVAVTAAVYYTTWKVGRDKVHKRCPLRWQQQLQNVFTFAAPCQ